MQLMRDLPGWGLSMKFDWTVLQNNQGIGKVLIKGNQLA
jgi:hypothetical protein